MNKLTGCAVVATLLSASPAIAQDTKFDGLNFGFGVGLAASGVDFDHVERNGAGVETSRERFSTDDSSFAGSVFAGYQKQFGRFVLGVEASYTAFENEDQARTDLNGQPRNREAITKDQIGVAARLGFVTGSTLFYSKAGVAFSQFEFHNYDIATGDDLGFATTDWEAGFLFGGGVDYSISPNMSIGVDYTGAVFDVGSVSMRDPATGITYPGPITNERMDAYTHSVMARLTMRFDGGRNVDPLK